jgi:hypothetical protein
MGKGISLAPCGLIIDRIESVGSSPKTFAGDSERIDFVFTATRCATRKAQ